jgi:hypothetical protein
MMNLSWDLRYVSESTATYIYASLAAIYWLIEPPPNAICIKCYDFERPMKSSKHLFH